uniref:Integrase, catalytic region, zinc finger, CCHC-type, peptidase aspartic, catalytic n=1 Tax=Tanacetum cinerariifolium TaxID=118510 RepID=A0A6L2MJM9_TANCI|nr:hypothetical protein [Tanacetum cinerariifolium]
MATTYSIVLSRKENGVNILKSVDEGPFQMRTFRETIVVKLNRGLKESKYDQLYAYLKQHEAYANQNKMMLERFTQHTVDSLALMSNVSPQQYSSQSSTTLPSTHVPSVSYQPNFADNTQLDYGLSLTDNLIKNLTNTLALLTQSYKTYLPQTNNQFKTLSNTRNQDSRVIVQNVQGRQNRGKETMQGEQENGVVLDEEQLLFFAGGQDNVVDEDVDESPVQELALNVDNVFQDDECNMFDFDDVVCEHHEVHEMHNNVQSNYVVDTYAEYMGDSNMIPYDQYVKDNAEPVVQNNVSFVLNDAYMMIINEIHKHSAQCVFVKAQTKVADASLTAELASYKEQVELYEGRAKFELTEREKKIEEQSRIVITDRNIKE